MPVPPWLRKCIIRALFLVHIPQELKTSTAFIMKPHKKHTWIDNATARVVLHIAMLATGCLLIIYQDAIQWLPPGELYYKEILVAAIAIFLLVLPVVSLGRFLKNQYALMQARQIQRQKADKRYSNALWLLCRRDDKQANALGLKEMVRMKQGGLIDPNRIDIITSAIDLAGASLNRADLQGAGLLDANLKDTSLKDTNLQGADLEDANLEGANLEGANLQDANLQRANLQGASLQGANLEGVKNLDPGMLRKAKNWREAKLDTTLRQQAEEADRAGEEQGEDGSLPGTMGLKNQ